MRSNRAAVVAAILLALSGTAHAQISVGPEGIEVSRASVPITGGTYSATVGPELAPALTAANWTCGAGWNCSVTGTLNKSGDGLGTAAPTTPPTIVAGTTYKVVITVGALTVASGATLTLGGNQFYSVSAAGTHTFYVTAATTGNFIVTPTPTATRFTITAVSIKALTAAIGDLTVEGDLTVRSPAHFDGPVTFKDGSSFPMSIRAFGATGNGVTDDTAAFQAAYASLAGAACGGAGGSIYLPAGTYVISSDLSWMCVSTGVIRLSGDSSGGTSGSNGASTILKYTGSGTMLTSRHLQLEHVRLQTTTGLVGLQLDRCNMDCWVNDVVVTGFATYGIAASSATSQFSTVLSRVRAYSNGWGLFISANRTNIRDGEFSGNTNGGILSDHSSALTITGNTIETNSGPGIKFATYPTMGVTIQGNYFENNTTADVLTVTGGGIHGGTISGNYMNGLSHTTTGIDCETCTDVLIAENNSLGHAYGVNIPSAAVRVTVLDSSPGLDTADYNSKNGLMLMMSSKGIDLPPVAFSGLSAWAGRIALCTNCLESDPCATGGNGAIARRVYNRWDCSSGGRTYTKTLVDNVATNFADVSIPQTAGSNYAGGDLVYTIFCKDASNQATQRGTVNFACQNLAGAESCGFGTPDGVTLGDGVASIGAPTFTAAGGTDVAQISVQSDCTGVTPTTFTMQYVPRMEQANLWTAK